MDTASVALVLGVLAVVISLLAFIRDLFDIKLGVLPFLEKLKRYNRGILFGVVFVLASLSLLFFTNSSQSLSSTVIEQRKEITQQRDDLASSIATQTFQEIRIKTMEADSQDKDQKIVSLQATVVAQVNEIALLQKAPEDRTYQYRFIGPVQCSHAGGAYIQVFVYSDIHDPNSALKGVTVRASGAPDAGPLGGVDLVTDSNGMVQYTLQTNLPAKPGTYYAWVLNGAGQRISEIGGPININNSGPDDPNACQLAKVAFASSR